MVAGFATLIKLVFAPPAMAIDAYFVFIGLNIRGVRIVANFELFVTVAASLELLVFMGAADSLTGGA